MKFCYLVRSRGQLRDNYSYLKNKDSAVYVSSWVDGHKKEDWFSLFFDPDTTWGEGRNLLLSRVKDMGYDYFIFMDDDAITDLQNGIPKLQDCLVRNEPSVLYPRISKAGRYTRDEMERTYGADHAVACFHKDAAKTLLPYYNSYQEQSWYYCQIIVNYLQYYFYDESRFQYNDMVYRNPDKIKSYGGSGKTIATKGARGTNWKFVLKKVLESLSDPKIRKLKPLTHGWARSCRVNKSLYMDFDENKPLPPGLVIEDKYKINCETYFNTDHDYYLQKKKFWGAELTMPFVNKKR